MKEMKQNNYTRFLIFSEIREPARKNILVAAEDIKKVNPLGKSGLTSFIILLS